MYDSFCRFHYVAQQLQYRGPQCYSRRDDHDAKPGRWRKRDFDFSEEYATSLEIEQAKLAVRIAEDNEREQLETKRIASKEQIEGAKLGVEIAKDVFKDE